MCISNNVSAATTIIPLNAKVRKYKIWTFVNGWESLILYFSYQTSYLNVLDLQFSKNI